MKRLILVAAPFVALLSAAAGTHAAGGRNSAEPKASGARPVGPDAASGPIAAADRAELDRMIKILKTKDRKRLEREALRM